MANFVLTTATPTRTLTIRLCEVLGEINGWHWSLLAPAPAEAVGVFYGAIPPEPDRAVGVRVYTAADDRDQPAWRRVQLRIRGPKGDPAGADDLADAAFAALHGLSRQGGMSGVTRSSMAPLGPDGNRREERTDNYLIVLDNPEALA